MVQAPIFHVNADDPEACVRVAELAFAYRQEFNKDVVIDMIGYRRHGHNEGDDPSYTQPMMYRTISELPSARTLYTQALIDRGDISVDEAERAISYFQDVLQGALDADQGLGPAEPGSWPAHRPRRSGCCPTSTPGSPGPSSTTIYQPPQGRPPRASPSIPKLARQFEARDADVGRGEVDWALGRGLRHRQPAGRGDLGPDGRPGHPSRHLRHRHATLHDYDTGEEFTPLASLGGDEANFWVYDSTAVGVRRARASSTATRWPTPRPWSCGRPSSATSSTGPRSSSTSSWSRPRTSGTRPSGLVMLLPHGYEGQGPEHSSGRLERPPALRRGQHPGRQRDDGGPVLPPPPTPDGAPQLTSAGRVHPQVGAAGQVVPVTGRGVLTHGSFEEVLDDPGVADPSTVTRVVLASGKVAVEAAEHRTEHGIHSAAIVRIEQLYPWPFAASAGTLERYPNATEIVWLQEEPENMGAWNAVKGRLYEAHGESYRIRRVSRPESGSPATGSAAIHRQEQAELLQRAFGGLDQA